MFIYAGPIFWDKSYFWIWNNGVFNCEIRIFSTCYCFIFYLIKNSIYYFKITFTTINSIIDSFLNGISSSSDGSAYYNPEDAAEAQARAANEAATQAELEAARAWAEATFNSMNIYDPNLADGGRIGFESGTDPEGIMNSFDPSSMDEQPKNTIGKSMNMGRCIYLFFITVPRTGLFHQVARLVVFVSTCL